MLSGCLAIAAFFLSLHGRELYRYYTMQKVIIIVEQSSDGVFGVEQKLTLQV